MMESVKRLPLQVSITDETDLPTSCRKIIESVFPTWTDNDLHFTPCQEGITNKLIRVDNLVNGAKVVIRIYGRGSECLIDRQQEISNHLLLNGNVPSLAPPLHAIFGNGLVAGWIEGRTLTFGELGEARWGRLVAQHLAQWHQLAQGSKNEPVLWKCIDKWIKLIEHVPESKWISQEVEWIKREKTTGTSSVLFCHNDLLAANIIVSPTNQVSFIDYEYAAMNYRSFDIANHFCEFAGLQCDYSLYPSAAYRREWIACYLDAVGEASVGVDELEEEVEIFSMVAHLYWSVWALVQAERSDLPFDYREYASLRLAEYKVKKSLLF